MLTLEEIGGAGGGGEGRNSYLHRYGEWYFLLPICVSLPLVGVLLCGCGYTELRCRSFLLYVAILVFLIAHYCTVVIIYTDYFTTLAFTLLLCLVFVIAVEIFLFR